MNESRPKPLHIILGIAGVIIAAVLYTVLGSKIGSPPAEEYTPEAYGVEKLEAEAPPAMKIAVWQRNEKNRAHFERDYSHKTFYDMIDLPMTEGRSVCTISENSFIERFDDNTEVALQILFEGRLSGRYELGYSSALHYSKDNDVMPFSNDKAFSNPGASFNGNDIVTISVQDIGQYVYLYEHKLYDGREINLEIIQGYEQSGSFDLDDYLTYEKITDVYESVPEEYQDCYRAVVTTHLYIYGSDPVKQDIVLAEAVLELKSHSRWIGLPPGQEELFTAQGLEDKSYTDVTVVSYTQSDSYALE